VHALRSFYRQNRLARLEFAELSAKERKKMCDYLNAWLLASCKNLSNEYRMKNAEFRAAFTIRYSMFIIRYSSALTNRYSIFN